MLTACNHHINIELCINCKEHNYYLNHNEQQYIQVYEESKLLFTF